jgi:hypothetical protein
MKAGIRDIVGKTVAGYALAYKDRSPKEQVLISFTNGYYFEFWGDELVLSSSLYSGSAMALTHYVEKNGGKVTPVFEIDTVPNSDMGAMQKQIGTMIGRTIANVLIAVNKRSPNQQVFIIFEDGTHQEIWGELFTCNNGLDRGDLEAATQYAISTGAKITSRTE